MIALEEQTLAILKNDIINWKRYVDDTYAYIKDTLLAFNNFKNKQKMYEVMFFDT